MQELRERLTRAVIRLEENRDLPGCSLTERLRLNGKIEGVKLALSYLDEDERTSTPTPDGEIKLRGLIGNPRYAEGLVTHDVTHFGFVSVDFSQCSFVSNDFLDALLREVKKFGAFGVSVSGASDDVLDRVFLTAKHIDAEIVVL